MAFAQAAKNEPARMRDFAHFAGKKLDVSSDFAPSPNGAALARRQSIQCNR